MANKHIINTPYTLAELTKIKPNDEVVLVAKDGKSIKVIKVK